MTESDPSQATWYLAVNRERLGPFTWAELVQRAIHGEIAPEQFVFRLGDRAWQRAKDVARLFDSISETVRVRATVGGSEPNVDGGESAHFPIIPGYKILRELGKGGMGRVYEAEQLELQRRVALKVLLAHDLRDDRLSEFKAAASVLVRIQHPNIVQVHDAGEHNGRRFIAMQLIEGGHLAGELRQEKWTIRRTVTFVERLARAVHAVHRAGFIHRCLTPNEILLTSDGEPILIDFSLTIAVEQSDRITSENFLVGTPSYMAPEQMIGDRESINARTDVYSLGVILYEMLTGQIPFQGALSTVTYHTVHTAPSRRELSPEVPPSLEAICLKCLAKRNRDRYESASALAEALSDFAWCGHEEA